MLRQRCEYEHNIENNTGKHSQNKGILRRSGRPTAVVVIIKHLSCEWTETAAYREFGLPLNSTSSNSASMFYIVTEQGVQ